MGGAEAGVTELLAEQGLIPLFSVPWPAQGPYANGEVADASGLEGLRFRAYDAALAGATPVQVEAVDIPQAFATGQVEAMITSPSTGANSTASDAVKRILADDHKRILADDQGG